MTERLLSVRGVKVPPGWVLKAIRVIREIVGGINRYARAEKGEAYNAGDAWLAEKFVYEAMPIFRQQRPDRLPSQGRQAHPRYRSRKVARLR